MPVLSKLNLNGITYDLKAEASGAVSGVKGEAEDTYRDGNVTITRENLGLGTASTRSVPTSGDANATQVVLGSDTRLKFKTWMGTCSSEADAQAKVVSVDTGFALTKGTRIGVKFTNSNTYSATADNQITLNVNSTGAKNIYYNNTNAPTGTNTNVFGYANRYIFYVYDGTNWVWDGSGVDNNTTYSAMSVSELTTGTATSQRTVRADYLHTAIQTMIDDSVGAAIAASY